MRIGSVSGIAGRGDFSLIRPVPDAETLPCVGVSPPVFSATETIQNFLLRALLCITPL